MKTRSFLTLVLVLTMLAVCSACGPKKPEPVELVPAPIKVAGHEIDLKAIYDKANNFYHVGVTDYEVPLTIMYEDLKASDNAFRMTIADLMANMGHCYKNVAETEAFIAEAVMGDQDTEALFSGLATYSVSGEQATTECVQLNKQIADVIVASRSDLKNKRMAVFELATKYEAYTSDYIEIAIMNDLMETYGDTALVYQKLADHGIGVTDWTWLPTSNLKAIHNNGVLCRYFMSGEFVQGLPYSVKLKFTGHEDALVRLYEASWIPGDVTGGAGECTMFRKAALWQMTRSIVGSDTGEVTGTGVDKGAVPTLAP